MENINPIQEKLIFDGEQYAVALFHEIEQATREILVANYIIENDAFGSRVIAALEEKAKEGVQVKLIVDGYGSWDWIADGKARSNEKLFDIRVYHPLPWTLGKIKNQNLNWERFFHFFSYINRRNHQKVFIFDRKKVMLGSRNVHQECTEWRETSVMLEGDNVGVVVDIFNTLWIRSHRKLFKRINYKKPFIFKEVPERIYSSHLLNWRRKNKARIFDRIKSATSVIQITTPYFLPTKKMLNLLYKKAKSGISVTLLLPEEADVQVSKWISQFHYELLLEAGVRIYEYKPSILHAKVTIVDDWALVGSSNFNQRSMNRDIELDYSIMLEQTVFELKEQFQKDILVSAMISSKKNMSVWKKAFVRILIWVVPSWF